MAVFDGFIDIHTHILPAIDDGAYNFAETVRMLDIAAREGIVAIIATPHFVPQISETNSEDVIQAVKLLNESPEGVASGISIFPGNEIYLVRGAYDSVESGRCLTLAGSRYVLCELPMNEYPSGESINELDLLLNNGYIPVIAHPERYGWLSDSMTLLRALIKRGCQIQLNSGAITGRYGKSVQKNAEKLLGANLVSYISSDCHDSRGRAPLMKSIYSQLIKRQGRECTDLLFFENAQNNIHSMKAASTI